MLVALKSFALRPLAPCCPCLRRPSHTLSVSMGLPRAGPMLASPMLAAVRQHGTATSGPHAGGAQATPSPLVAVSHADSPVSAALKLHLLCARQSLAGLHSAVLSHSVLGHSSRRAVLGLSSQSSILGHVSQRSIQPQGIGRSPLILPTGHSPFVG